MQRFSSLLNYGTFQQIKKYEKSINKNREILKTLYKKYAKLKNSKILNKWDKVIEIYIHQNFFAVGTPNLLITNSEENGKISNYLINYLDSE